MKTLLCALIVGVLLISCSKEAEKTNQLSAHFGMYTAINGDTATVSQGNDGMIKIKYATYNPIGLRAIFDSVRLNSDNIIFTCNEFVDWPVNRVFQAVGAGSFGENMIAFQFVVGGSAHVNFSGIKKQ